MRYAVIMAGGSGTRLWPMSTRNTPKQLIRFIQGKSLLEVAVDRLDGLIPTDHRLICTGESIRGSIRSAMPGLTDERILGEPEGRDTLAAVGFPAAVLSLRDPDAVIAVFTADHLIEPLDVFQKCVQTGFEIAESQSDTLVTFGIKPTHAATGYGYVRLGSAIEGFDGAHRTVEFKEKPNAAAAEQYIASGEYCWNSGMFVWRASTLLKCIEKYAPDVHAGLMEIAAAWDTAERGEVLRRIYPTLTRISVDFAVMEKASRDEAVNVATVSMPVSWLDVGSWPAFGDTITPDADGNRTAAARSIVMKSRNNLLASSVDKHVIATVGVENLIVIHTPHATLICHKDEAEEIKQLHAAVGEQFGADYL